MKNETRHLQLNKAKWDQWAGSMDRKSWRTDFLRAAQSKVISLLNIQENIHFLDVGCGTGWAVGEVAKLAGDQGLFYGVDLSSAMIEKAKSNFRGRDNFRFIQADVDSIPLGDDFFDIIICTNSFHHYLNPGKALSEMHRLLKSGGKLYILDPTANVWIMKLADQIVKHLEPEHVKMYSSKEFQALFSQAGLKYKASKAINWRQGIHVGEK
jgi:ubiquinone/menaquinone biosynthesis C-methylase UbiE